MDKSDIVLVHGAFADASSWAEVIGLLQAQGHRVTGVQLALRSLADDFAATERVLDAQEGMVVLAGHSYGGNVITQAGTHAKVASLRYVAALAPDIGETLGSLAAGFSAAPAMSALQIVGGLVQLSQADFITYVAHDVAPDRARIAASVQRAVTPDLFNDQVTRVGWKEKPSSYAISTADKVIAPELQRFFAKRMRAQTIELDSSHASPLSHAEEVARFIAE